MQQKWNVSPRVVEEIFWYRSESPQRSQAGKDVFISLANAEGFNVRYDTPTVEHRDSSGEGGLPAVGYSVADLFEVHSSWQGLHLGASQICWQGVETLPHGSVAVVIRAVTH